jgi:pantoate--beta-alanine ligase
LSPAERQQALALWRSLTLAERLVQQGQRAAAAIVAEMQAEILRVPQAQIEYVALVDPRTLVPVTTIVGRTLAVLAVRIGKTRLIDNLMLGE